MKKSGFTLAEVLITLGIIGVVAAITIPGLINNYKAQRLHSKFLKTYSVLQQVFKQMEADDVSLDPNSYPYAQPFYKTFMKYLTNTTNCGRVGGNYGDPDIRTAPCYNARAYKYRDYSGKSTISESLLDDGQIVLPDGTIVFFENTPGKRSLAISRFKWFGCTKQMGSRFIHFPIYRWGTQNNGQPGNNIYRLEPIL